MNELRLSPGEARAQGIAIYAIIGTALLTLTFGAYGASQALAGRNFVTTIIILTLALIAFVLHLFYAKRVACEWDVLGNGGRWRLAIAGLVVPILVAIGPLIAFAVLAVFVIFSLISLLGRTGPAPTFDGGPSPAASLGHWWGESEVIYDEHGRATWIGNERVLYGSDGRLSHIGDRRVRYGFDGRMAWVGNDQVLSGRDGSPGWIGKERVVP